MKKKILLALSFLAVAGLSIGGTIAYFHAQDTDVNTFTYGNIAIEQLQYEREVDANGNWIVTDTKDKYGFYPEKVVEYRNDKQLLPAVFSDGDIKWDDRTTENGKNHQQSWGQIDAPGSFQLFDDSVKNVHDNFVFVKNTGDNDAYVRTYFAFEQGNLEVSEYLVRNGKEVPYAEYFDVIEMNTNDVKVGGHWSWELIAKDYVIYDENNQPNKYIIMCATYLGAGSKGYTGILEHGTTSYVSLAQVYMRPAATQEDIELLDGNNNGKFDLLIASQAVQTDGFVGLYETGLEDAKNAFTKAFGNNLPFKIEPTN